jgi:hypothetical protein
MGSEAGTTCQCQSMKKSEDITTTPFSGSRRPAHDTRRSCRRFTGGGFRTGGRQRQRPRLAHCYHCPVGK